MQPILMATVERQSILNLLLTPRGAMRTVHAAVGVHGLHGSLVVSIRLMVPEP